MSGGIDEVRARFDEAEDIDMGGVPEAAEPPPGEDGPPEGPPPDEDMRAALEEAALLPLNDYGNGQRFVRHFGDDAMFVPRVGWFVWRGSHWEKDPDQLAVRGRAQRLSSLIEREIPYLALTPAEREMLAAKADTRAQIKALEDAATGEESAEDAARLVGLRARMSAIGRVEKKLGERRAQHRRFATTTGNSTRIDNAMKEAAIEKAVLFEALDADPLAVNTLSGLLRFRVQDMAEEGGGKVAEVEQVPHDRAQRATKLVPVRYDPAAPDPERFHAFLERVQPDREIREFLKRWLGLSMTGLPMQRLVFLHGAGANGKSVLVDVAARILGSYSATARIESLTGSSRRGGGDATPDLIPLMGARMVRTSEPDEGQRLQEGLIKELTGGEPIQVRALHSDFIEVRPIFKLTMSGNHKPEIRGTDDGIWRRVLLVPFDVQIPESERDPTLVETLWEKESAGILRWLVEGLVDVLEGGLAPPDAVLAATREYREESDPIGVFLTSCCVVTGDPGDTIPSKQLGDAFAYHLIERGMSAWKPATFAKQISNKSRHWRHPETGRQFHKGKASISQYVGLRLTDAFRRRFDDAPRDHQGRPLGVAASSSADAPNPDMDF